MQDEGERQDELRLLARLRERDRSALQEVDAAYRAGLIAALTRIAHDQALAEDAVQEALLALWSHPPEPRSDTSLRAWLLVTARHALNRRWQRDTRANPFAGSASRTRDVSLETLGLEAGWGSQELGQRAEQALASRQCLERGFAKLLPESREVLVLVDIEELPLEESAVVIGVSLAALKSRLHRARLQLIAALTREDCHAP